MTRLALFALTASFAWAQIETGLVVGTVADASGAKIAGAKLALTSDRTGRVIELATNSEGFYQSPPLTPGTYRIAAEQTGFKKAVSTVLVEVNQRVAADFQLEIGDISQQVEVTATAGGLETESTSLGNIRSSKAVAELPLNARNYAFLIGMAPGAVQTQDRAPGALPGTSRRGVSNFAVNGVRGTNDWNGILVEGVDNTENHNGLGSVIFPPIDAIQEFRVQTSNADAQFGRAAGGITNLVLKSGGKDFHGSLYEFHRNFKFDALNYFARPGDDQKFILNQFGFTLGGPVALGRYNKAKDKTFFFASTQWDKRRQAVPNVSSVPTARMRNGDFGESPNRIFDPLTQRAGNVRDQFPLNAIPASRFNTAGKKTADLYPLPNSPGLVNNYTGAPVRLYDGYQTDIKVDHYFAPIHSAVFRASFGDTTNNDGPVLPLPAASNIGATQQPVGQYSVIDRFNFSPNKLNEFRFGFTRFNLRLVQPNAGRNVANELGIPGVNTGDQLTTGMPRISVTGFQVLGDDPFNPGVLVTNNFQTEDNFFWTVSRHSLRMGFRYDRRQYNAYQTSAVRGLMNFSGVYTNNPAAAAGTGIGLADLQLGAPINGNISILEGTRGFRRHELGFYLQDDWKATDRLTLNLGLRYELYPTYPWTEVGNRMAQFVAERAALVPVGTNGISATGVKVDKNNWAPRVGLAYKLNDKTVVRSGFGVFYAAPQYEISRNLAVNPPFAGAFAYTNNQLDFPGARRIDQGFDRTFRAEGSTFNGIDPNLRMPYVLQWNFNVQRQLPSSLLLTVAYVGTKGVKLRDEVNINQPRPGPGAIPPRRLFPVYNDIAMTQFRANSSYNALQTTLERRLAKGLNLLFAYTWSHAIDDAGQFGGDHQDVLNLRGDRGNAPFDIRHSAVTSFNYELPSPSSHKALRLIAGGWQTNGILRLSAGLPLTPTMATSTLNGSGFQRANVVAGCNWRLDNPTPLRWFDTSCFNAPPQFVFGNAGRNTVTGPGTRQFDFSLFKNIAFTERVRSQFRAEMFNITNTPQFNNPNTAIGNPQAGVINSAGAPPSFQRTSRQIQLALKLMF
jgi:outer membrane receptor protein involved in Fe transport